MSRPKKSRTETGRFAYEGLDRLLHEKARLGILTSLITRPEGVAFIELRALCDLTDGNLARHLEALEGAGLVVSEKSQGEGRPKTMLRLSAPGRKRFLEYLEELERVVRDARAAAAAGPKRRALGDDSRGLAPA